MRTKKKKVCYRVYRKNGEFVEMTWDNVYSSVRYKLSKS